MVSIHEDPASRMPLDLPSSISTWGDSLPKPAQLLQGCGEGLRNLGFADPRLSNLRSLGQECGARAFNRLRRAESGLSAAAVAAAGAAGAAGAVAAGAARRNAFSAAACSAVGAAAGSLAARSTPGSRTSATEASFSSSSSSHASASPTRGAPGVPPMQAELQLQADLEALQAEHAEAAAGGGSLRRKTLGFTRAVCSKLAGGGATRLGKAVALQAVVTGKAVAHFPKAVARR